jgi:uncharacterized protein
MTLEGVVTNVTNFGAFVDIGVHQDGLVHISALSNSFVKDPHTVVKTGDVVKVKVMEVDVKRQRIGLSMRLDDDPATRQTESASRGRSDGARSSNRQQPQQRSSTPVKTGTLGDLLKGAMKK